MSEPWMEIYSLQAAKSIEVGTRLQNIVLLAAVFQWRGQGLMSSETSGTHYINICSYGFDEAIPLFLMYLTIFF